MDEIPIPKKLYKYQPYNQKSLGNLGQRCLWFSRHQQFNDPFDCDINFTPTDVNEDSIKDLFAYYQKSVPDRGAFDARYLDGEKINGQFLISVVNSAQQATNVIKKMFWEDIGIACFSESNDNILMWSHYANGHQGFCMEFDTGYYPFKKDGGEPLYKVDYPESNSFPPLSVYDVLHEKLPRLSKILLTTKSHHWKYENEWRILLALAGDKAYPFDVEGLTAIYFGCRMSKRHKMVIASMFADPPTRLFQMQKSEDGFTVFPRAYL